MKLKYDRMNAEILKDLSEQLDRAAILQRWMHALKNPDIIIDGGSLTLERVQVMEDGGIRILPMPPADTCTEQVSREFGKKT